MTCNYDHVFVIAMLVHILDVRSGRGLYSMDYVRVSALCTSFIVRSYSDGQHDEFLILYCLL